MNILKVREWTRSFHWFLVTYSCISFGPVSYRLVETSDLAERESNWIWNKLEKVAASAENKTHVVKNNQQANKSCCFLSSGDGLLSSEEGKTIAQIFKFNLVCAADLSELLQSDYYRKKYDRKQKLMSICHIKTNVQKETEDRKETTVPNRLRLRRGGGGGVGGCGVFAPRREMSTSTRDTVSPGEAEEEGKEVNQQECHNLFVSCFSSCGVMSIVLIVSTCVVCFTCVLCLLPSVVSLSRS